MLSIIANFMEKNNINYDKRGGAAIARLDFF
jgi:hypothetical protein